MDSKECVDKPGHGAYDVRFVAIESRIAAVEVDVAVIRTSFATKDDIQRVLTVLYEHKLEVHRMLGKQSDEFHAALAEQREDLHAALNKVQLDLHKALISHLWKLYGFASLMLGGVYFIARYVH